MADPFKRFSVNPDVMTVSHQAWFNTFIAAFIVECELLTSQGKVPSVQRFCQEKKGANSADSLRNLGGLIIKVAGIKYRPKGNYDFAPRSLTALGTYQVEKLWQEYTRKSRPSDDTAKAAEIGQAMQEQNLMAYEPETQTIIPIEDIIETAE